MKSFTKKIFDQFQLEHICPRCSSLVSKIESYWYDGWIYFTDCVCDSCSLEFGFTCDQDQDTVETFNVVLEEFLIVFSIKDTNASIHPNKPLNGQEISLPISKVDLQNYQPLLTKVRNLLAFT